MKTVLIIKAAEVRPFAEGKLNNTMVEIAEKTLGNDYKVIKTDVNSGYDVTEEQEKFKSADLVIFQYPMYWFSMPSSLKKYMDDVYAYGVFFEGSENYGFSGLMKGKKYMLSLIRMTLTI